MTVLKRRLFQYQGHIGAALVLGGVDITGSHLYTIYPHGRYEPPISCMHNLRVWLLLGLEPRMELLLHPCRPSTHMLSISQLNQRTSIQYIYASDMVPIAGCAAYCDSTDKLPFVSMGSGSLAAMAMLESGYRDGLTEEDAKLLVRDAIRAGIFNDLGSGSNVDLTVIREVRRPGAAPDRSFPQPKCNDHASIGEWYVYCLFYNMTVFVLVFVRMVPWRCCERTSASTTRPHCVIPSPGRVAASSHVAQLRSYKRLSADQWWLRRLPPPALRQEAWTWTSNSPVQPTDTRLAVEPR